MKIIIIITAILYSTGIHVLAQSQEEPSPNKEIKINNDDLKTIIVSDVAEKSFSPFGGGSLSNFISNVSIASYFEQGVKGRIEIQRKTSSKWNGGLSVEQTIGKSDKQSVPLSLAGISSGTTVEINVIKLFWKPSFKLDDEEIGKLDKITQGFSDRNNDKLDSRTIGLLDLFKYGTEAEKRAALGAFDAKKFKTPIFIEFKPGFTKTSFSYSTDSVKLSAVKEQFITPSVTVSLVKPIGKSFSVTGYLAVSYTYSESYTASDEMSFNVPFGNTGNFYSNTVAFGKPTKSTTNNISVEYRQNISGRNSDGVALALSPLATFGIDNKNMGVFLPIYLIRGINKDGDLLEGLQAGVRFGYTTSIESDQVSSFKEGFIAQLIISQPLSVFNDF